MFRTHTCGELRSDHINMNVRLSGWVQRIRDKGDIDLDIIRMAQETAPAVEKQLSADEERVCQKNHRLQRSIDIKSMSLNDNYSAIRLLLFDVKENDAIAINRDRVKEDDLGIFEPEVTDNPPF